MNEFDELEIETISASLSAHHNYEDDCAGEQSIDEYGGCGTVPQHHHHPNAGCTGCLVMISTGVLLAAGLMILLMAAF